jgi:hypothetical protein
MTVTHIGSRTKPVPDKDQIDNCEPGTSPLTEHEHSAIRFYTNHTAGFAHYFSGGSSLDDIPAELTHAQKSDMFRSGFTMLADWRFHLGILASDFTSGQELGEAGRRYLQLELTRWKQAQEQYRVMAIEYMLGRDHFGRQFTTADTVHGCQVDGGHVSYVFQLAEQV